MKISRIKNRISEAATEACGYSPLTKVVSEEEIKDFGAGKRMDCNGRCQYLNERKHKCELTGEKLTYMKQTGSISFSVHEHRGFCKGDENSAHDR